MAQQVNLIDISLRPARQNLPPAALLAAVAAAGLLLTTHFAWEKWALARELALAVAPVVVADSALDGAAQSQRAARLVQREALRDLMRLQVSVAEGSAKLMGDIIRAMPEDMWLTELEVGASATLRLSGASADSASFSQFTSRLENIAALKSLPLHTVRLEPLVPEGAAAAQDQTTPTGRQFVLVSGTGDDAAAAPVTAALAGGKP